MEIITKEQAEAAARCIIELAQISLSVHHLLETPWVACEQQMMARVMTARNGEMAANAQAWKAGHILRTWFRQQGKLIEEGYL